MHDECGMGAHATVPYPHTKRSLQACECISRVTYPSFEFSIINRCQRSSSSCVLPRSGRLGVDFGSYVGNSHRRLSVLGDVHVNRFDTSWASRYRYNIQRLKRCLRLMTIVLVKLRRWCWHCIHLWMGLLWLGVPVGAVVGRRRNLTVVRIHLARVLSD